MEWNQVEKDLIVTTKRVSYKHTQYNGGQMQQNMETDKTVNCKIPLKKETPKSVIPQLDSCNSLRLVSPEICGK